MREYTKEITLNYSKIASTFKSKLILKDISHRQNTVKLGELQVLFLEQNHLMNLLTLG